MTTTQLDVVASPNPIWLEFLDEFKSKLNFEQFSTAEMLKYNEFEEKMKKLDPTISQALRAGKSTKREWLLQTKLLSVAVDFETALNQLPMRYLERAALAHFQSLLGSTFGNMKISPKVNGNQFGAIITITSAEHSASETKYYVKTHEKGLQNSTCSTGVVTAISAKELFSYKMLELLGLGPIVQSFYQNAKDFYICTTSINETSFVVYDQFKEKAEFEMEWKQLLADVQRHEDTQFALSCVELDLMTRFLALTDTLSNPSNFGVLCGSMKLKLIDFRERDPEYYEGLDDCTLESFTAETSSSDKLLNCVLNSSPERKIALAKTALKEFQKNTALSNTVNKANEWLRQSIQGWSFLSNAQKEQIIREVDGYSKVFLSRVENFQKELDNQD